MDRYVGTYRVEIERDIHGKPQDATYIPCQYGSTLYRYNDNTIALNLVTSSSRNIVIPKIKKYVKLFTDGDGESTWLFDEKYMDEVCEVVKPKIHGKYKQPKDNF